MKVLGKMIAIEKKITNVRHVTKMVCDNCHQELHGLYAEIRTGHRRWGNDSCDSIKYHDMCFECAKKMFNDYLTQPEETDCLEYEVMNVEDSIGEEVEVQENGELYVDDWNSCVIVEDQTNER